MKKRKSPFSRKFHPLQKKFISTDKPKYSLEARKALAMVQKSSGLSNHRVATDKLRELDFDPIEKLIEELEDIDRMIAEERSSSSPRWSYLEKLKALRTRILEVLLPYRYGKAPITTVEHEDSRDPIRIILSTEGDKNDNN